jgi:ankyrin repeat protein
MKCYLLSLDDALLLAAKNGHIEIVKIHLQNGAKWTQKVADAADPTVLNKLKISP